MKEYIKKISWILTLIMISQQILSNKYMGVYFDLEHPYMRNPYYQSMRMYNGVCGGINNFFKEIILPFTDPNYRILTFKKTTFFHHANLDPLKVLSSWYKTSMSKEFSFHRFKTNGRTFSLIHTCNKDHQCYILEIKNDPHKIHFLGLKEMKHLIKSKYVLPIKAYSIKNNITFALKGRTHTSLKDLINQKILDNVHKLNITSELLEMADEYMKYKIIHGDLKPAKILVNIDTNHNTKLKKYTHSLPRVASDSRFFIKLSGFDRFHYLRNHKNKRFIPDVYENGTGLVSLKDIRVLRSGNLKPYPKYYSPYEMVFEKDLKYGISVDLFALGGIILEMWQNSFEDIILPNCHEIKDLDECKNKFNEYYEKLQNWDEKKKPYRKCITNLIYSLTRKTVINRSKPERAHNKLIECLKGFGFLTEDEEEIKKDKEDVQDDINKDENIRRNIEEKVDIEHIVNLKKNKNKKGKERIKNLIIENK